MSDIIPVNDLSVMADSIVKSGFYGFKTKEQVIAVMLVAQAENKHPATVVQEYDVIQGRPALKSQAILARFQLSGGKVKWNEVSRTKCSGTFSHPAGGDLTVEWTIDMAKQAGLYRGGSGWEKYPEDMLRARVISRAVRSLYPACILGHYAVEEVMDFDEPKIKDITPPKPVLEKLPEVAVDPVMEVDFNEGIHALRLPNQEEPYKMYNTHQEWVDGFTDLLSKIYANNKISDEEKEEKYFKLCEANQYMISHLPAVEKTVYTHNTVKIRRGE